jgi:hypothetical protein
MWCTKCGSTFGSSNTCNHTIIRLPLMVPWGPKHVAVGNEIQYEYWLIIKPRLLCWQKPCLAILLAFSKFGWSQAAVIDIMCTSLHILSVTAKYLLEWKMFLTRILEKIKHILCSVLDNGRSSRQRLYSVVKIHKPWIRKFANKNYEWNHNNIKLEALRGEFFFYLLLMIFYANKNYYNFLGFYSGWWFFNPTSRGFQFRFLVISVKTFIDIYITL